MTSAFHRTRAVAAIVLATFMLVSGCKKSDSEDNIPNVAVDIYLPLSLPAYSALNSVGNSVLISGGYKGIIVFRRSIDAFAAYERACPYDPQVSGSIIEPDSSSVIGVDKKCGSKFSFFDGSIVNGPAARPMKAYNCDYDAATQSLHIYN